MCKKTLMNPLTIVLVAATWLAGCASNPASFADRLNAEGARTVALAENWEQGHELVKDGESERKSGEKRIAKGEKLLAQGQRLIGDGEERIAAHMQAYRSASARFGLATTPKQLETELKSLKSIAGKWADALEDVERGQKLVEQGQELLERGHTETRVGQDMIARGQAMMLAAEADYQARAGEVEHYR